MEIHETICMIKPKNECKSMHMGLNTTSIQNLLCGFQIAQQAGDQRLRGGASAKVQPSTKAQQHFIQVYVVHEKLDTIKQDAIAIQLIQIATDINKELDRQDKMLDEVDQQIDIVQEKLESRNNK